MESGRVSARPARGTRPDWWRDRGRKDDRAPTCSRDDRLEQRAHLLGLDHDVAARLGDRGELRHVTGIRDVPLGFEDVGAPEAAPQRWALDRRETVRERAHDDRIERLLRVERLDQVEGFGGVQARWRNEPALSARIHQRHARQLANLVRDGIARNPTRP